MIRAPDDGVAAKVEQLQVGDYITAATPVFSLISSQDVWVEANFKEDELTYMRPGQSAEVRIDAYPGRRFRATVASAEPGHGRAVFAAAARERDRQLGQGRAARSGATAASMIRISKAWCCTRDSVSM